VWDAMWSGLADGITKLWHGGRANRKSACMITVSSVVLVLYINITRHYITTFVVVLL
jgi:hypothetical protein